MIQINKLQDNDQVDRRMIEWRHQTVSHSNPQQNNPSRSNHTQLLFTLLCNKLRRSNPPTQRHKHLGKKGWNLSISEFEDSMRVSTDSERLWIQWKTKSSGSAVSFLCFEWRCEVALFGGGKTPQMESGSFLRWFLWRIRAEKWNSKSKEHVCEVKESTLLLLCINNEKTT